MYMYIYICIYIYISIDIISFAPTVQVHLGVTKPSQRQGLLPPRAARDQCSQRDQCTRAQPGGCGAGAAGGAGANVTGGGLSEREERTPHGSMRQFFRAQCGLRAWWVKNKGDSVSSSKRPAIDEVDGNSKWCGVSHSEGHTIGFDDVPVFDQLGNFSGLTLFIRSGPALQTPPREIPQHQRERGRIPERI